MKLDRMINIKSHYSKYYPDDKLSLNDDNWLDDNEVLDEEIFDKDDDITWENDWTYSVKDHHHYFYGY